jgi:hypothetical protein
MLTFTQTHTTHAQGVDLKWLCGLGGQGEGGDQGTLGKCIRASLKSGGTVPVAVFYSRFYCTQKLAHTKSRTHVCTRRGSGALVGPLCLPEACQGG